MLPGAFASLIHVSRLLAPVSKLCAPTEVSIPALVALCQAAKFKVFEPGQSALDLKRSEVFLTQSPSLP